MGIFDIEISKEVIKQTELEVRRRNRKDVVKKASQTLVGETKLNNTIDTTSGKYKTLTRKLQKYDNEKTDAIRMALLYLEDKDFTVDRLDKFLK